MTNTKHTAAPATIALLGGIATSLAGNLQAINLGDSAPGIGAYVSAIVWPVFLFVAIEVMLRTPWVSGARDSLTKWVGLTGVAFLALYISYGHLSHVLAAYGYDTVASHIGPLAVDGLMAMATLSMNRVGQARKDAATASTPAATVVQQVSSVLASVDTALSNPTGFTLSDVLPQPLADVPADKPFAVPAVQAADAPLEIMPPKARRATGKVDEVEAKALIVAGLEAGVLAVGEIDALVGAWFEVHPRTIRRLRERLGLVSVSAVPASA